MKIIYENNRRSTDGFLYVTTKHKKYYEYAINAAESFRDFSEEAHITLCTNEDFLDNRAYELFDTVVVEIPVHKRAKLWCMARTPYQRTACLDVDSFINDESIIDIFNELKDNDVMYAFNTAHTVGNKNIRAINGDEKLYHGAVCLYNNKPKTMAFMQEWFDSYLDQQTYKDKWPWPDIHRDWIHFDMCVLWRMINNYQNDYPQFKDIKVGILHRKWNSTSLDLKSDIDEPPVIIQYPSTSLEKDIKTIEKRLQNQKIKVSSKYTKTSKRGHPLSFN